MARLNSELVLSKLRVSDDPRKRRLWLLALSYAGLAVLTASSCLTKPRPYHTSVLRGRDWVQELVDGHHQRIKDSLGVRRSVFLWLCLELVKKGALRPTRHVDVPEHVALFLWAAVTNLSNRHIAEKFQRSGSTVSQYDIP
jgi:hypothetical protein